jgi:Holliday junction resolvase RusA-like endonuclease
MFLDNIPPSVNHAYVNIRGGGRTLSKAGLGYKNEVKVHLTKNYRKELMVLKPDTQTVIKIVLGIPTMFNESFGDKKGAASKYKKIDISNRVKLLEDVIKDVTNVDDSCTEALMIVKKVTEKEQTEIYISQEPSDYGGIFTF